MTEETWEGVWSAALGVGVMLGLTIGSLVNETLGICVGLAGGTVAAAPLYHKNHEVANVSEDAELVERQRQRQRQEQARDGRWSSRLGATCLINGVVGAVIIALLLYATNPDTVAFMAWRAKELKAASPLDAVTPPESRDLHVCSFYVVNKGTQDQQVYAGLLDHFFELKNVDSSTP